jgi:hypothetical protein
MVVVMARVGMCMGVAPEEERIHVVNGIPGEIGILRRSSGLGHGDVAHHTAESNRAMNEWRVSRRAEDRNSAEQRGGVGE